MTYEFTTFTIDFDKNEYTESDLEKVVEYLSDNGIDSDLVYNNGGFQYQVEILDYNDIESAMELIDNFDLDSYESESEG